MNPKEIKEKLKDKELTYRDLAKRWGVTSSAISSFINGDMKSARLEKRLAGVLGVSVEFLRGHEEAKNVIN